jgi:hypothetical protein
VLERNKVRFELWVYASGYNGCSEIWRCKGDADNEERICVPSVFSCFMVDAGVLGKNSSRPYAGLDHCKSLASASLI